MIEIGVKNLRKLYGVKLIFENVSFELHSGEIVGLIGQNGVGKTTLLKILAGDENYSGEIFLRKGLKVSYLDQIPEFPDNATVFDVLYKAFTDVLLIKRELSGLEKKMASAYGDELNIILNQYSKVQTQFEIIGGYAIDEKLAKIITGLDLEDLLNRPFCNLSGGEKTRVMLGKVLLENPDVLLLDEPTNHLDIKNITWLEEYLIKYNGSVILISHDRYFLDKVTNRIMELTQNGTDIYHGNYSYYKLEKQRRFEEAMKNYLIQKKKIERMEEQIKRYRIWGEMRDSNKMFRRAKELEKRLSKIDELAKPSNSKKVNIAFSSTDRTGKLVYELQNVAKQYDDKPLLKNINLEIYYQDCLAIIGENGSGKSTLLKLINQEIVPDEGIIRSGSRLNVGYLPQEIHFPDESQTILEVYQNHFDSTINQARSALARVLFIKDDVKKQVGMLSGGEKVRLKLLLLMDKSVNVLLLDEPTNHLDIDSREILEASLSAFSGTIIMISHDRYFINSLANRIAEIKKGQLTVYEGDYEYYLLKKEEDKVNIKVKTKEKIRNKVPEKESTVSEETILAIIEGKEQEIEAIINLMNENYQNIEMLKELKVKKKQIEEEIDKLYERLEKMI